MKRIPESGISVLLSFAAGASLVGFGMMNYESKTEKPTTHTVRTVSDTATSTPTPMLTPTYDITPPGVEAKSTPKVEGDDGSLGGPVLNEANQVEPTHIIRSPEKTVRVQDEPTSEATTPTASATPSDTSDSDGNGNATPASRIKGPDGRDIVEPTPASPSPSGTSEGE
jgi:hypothetical protein